MKNLYFKVLSLTSYFCVFFFIQHVKAQSYIITTYAGDSTYGFSGDGGPATAAELSAAFGVAADTVGNVFVCDEDNYRVRKVDTAGIITTIAGNGGQGYGSDGGQATNAPLNQPTGVAADDSGNIYIADYMEHRIRKVNTKGIITTVAGNGTAGFSGDNGPATAAMLDAPLGLAVDDSGVIYMADDVNNRIRMVNKKGIITTIAGNGGSGYSGDNGPATMADLNTPEGVGVDDSGNVYIADTWNSVIRKVNKSGIITTIVGNGTTGYTGDGGVATLAQLHNPEGVAIDTFGNIYISDWLNQRIRKVNTGDTITTIAGSGATGFAGGGYSGDGGPATDALLNSPYGIAVDLSGNVFIGDWGNARVRKLCPVPVMPGNISGSTIICSGTPQTFSISPVPGAKDYTWTLPDGWTGASNTTSITVIPGSSGGTISVTANSDCVTSAAQLLQVTVNPAPNKPTITISVTGDSLISSASTDNQWYLNDTLLTDSTRQVLVINGKPFGGYTVTVTNEANGCSSTSDSLGLTGSRQFGINTSQLSVYPNPTTGLIVLTINSSVENVNTWKMDLSDVLGRIVFTKQTLNYYNSIDLSYFPSGVYFISVINKAGKAVFPVVKQN